MSNRFIAVLSLETRHRTPKEIRQTSIVTGVPIHHAASRDAGEAGNAAGIQVGTTRCGSPAPLRGAWHVTPQGQSVMHPGYHRVVPKYSIVVPFHNEEENVTALRPREARDGACGREL